MWYKNRKELPPGAAAPDEVVFEVIDGSDAVGCGVAFADIKRSQRHYHIKTFETYTLVSGELTVHLGDKLEVLRRPGDSVAIPVRTPHWAESTSEAPARVAVLTMPPWTAEDHLLL
jgi:mannose-6-phosphate isomerase-like protein (cupin superfamily)